MNGFAELSPVDLNQHHELRKDVRRFIREYRQRHDIEEWFESWEGFSAEFSRALGQRGWIGMTWPRAFGGRERSALERHVVLEELLAAGAPVAAHWIADRQTGPHLLKFGSEHQRLRFLPRIAKGECYFCIGMSEPDAGSDLASISTRAEKVVDGWLINGTKLWTTYAHRSHYMIALCRTGSLTGKRHGGMSQFIIDLAEPAVEIRPIRNLAGEAHFSEVVFNDLVLEADALVGREGNGWQQVMSELAFERSGPDRFMSLHRLLERLVDAVTEQPEPIGLRHIGRLTSHLWALRNLSGAIAGELDAGRAPELEAALVKDLGTRFEQEIPGIVRELTASGESQRQNHLLRQLQQYAILHAPSYTVRGGTKEVMRSIIARGLGLR
jgi:alkylation response protein AidB-like acyl-CoA dehydrogenase